MAVSGTLQGCKQKYSEYVETWTKLEHTLYSDSRQCFAKLRKESYLQKTPAVPRAYGRHLQSTKQGAEIRAMCEGAALLPWALHLRLPYVTW